MAISTIDEIIGAALSLSQKERLQIIGRLASSLEHEIEESTAPQTEEHWGRRVIALLDSFNLSEWEAMEIDDPVEWVRKLREDERASRLGDWGAE